METAIILTLIVWSILGFMVLFQLNADIMLLDIQTNRKKLIKMAITIGPLLSLMFAVIASMAWTAAALLAWVNKK